MRARRGFFRSLSPRRPGVPRHHPTTRREGFAPSTRATPAPTYRPATTSPARTRGFPSRAILHARHGAVVALALVSLSPIHTTQARDDRGACGWGYSGRGGRRTRSPRAHPHPRSANPPFWFSAGAERRHHRRARTTTHTTPSSRRVAYIARLSRDPRCARCSAHLKPRHGGRGRRVALCASAVEKKSKGLVS